MMDLEATNSEGLLASWRPASVVVLRALQFGDLLCAVPAFRALRKHLPESRITLVGLPWANDFCQRFSAYVDEFVEFPGWPGLPEREPEVRAIPLWLREMQERGFDLAIQMHGSGSYVNTLTELLGAGRSAGFCPPGEWCPDQSSFFPYPEGDHEIHMLLRLMQFLGVPPDGDRLEFPTTPQDRWEYESLVMRLRIRSPYVCIHPGARLASRRWDATRFAAVADALHDDGYTIVVTGAAWERPVVDRMLRAARCEAVDLCGKTSVGTLGVLLSKAALLISNDTGVSHVAAALGVPSIVLTLGSDPGRWAPLDVERHRIIQKPIPCRPCMYDICPIGHPCATAITPGDVIGLARGTLRHFAYRRPPEYGRVPGIARASGSGATPS